MSHIEAEMSHFEINVFRKKLQNLLEENLLNRRTYNSYLKQRLEYLQENNIQYSKIYSKAMCISEVKSDAIDLAINYLINSPNELLENIVKEIKGFAEVNELLERKIQHLEEKRK